METWDGQSGDWQGLGRPSQATRYREIAWRIQQLCAVNAGVLDVGCGEGLLRDYLPEGTQYAGIEPSKEAAANGHNGHLIVQSTAEHYHFAGRNWDCVVLNEVLYYCRDPFAVLEKYQQALLPCGIFVVSIYQKQQTLRSRLSGALKHAMTNERCSRVVEKFMQQRLLFSTTMLAPTTTHRHRIWVGARDGKAE